MPFTRQHFPPPSLRVPVFLRANRFFLMGIGLLLLLFLYLLFTNQQGDELIAINKLRTPGWDRFFIAGTKLGEPIAYVFVLMILLFYRIRTALFSVVTGVTVAIVAGLLKVTFAQARPMRYFFDNFEETWHTLNLFDEPMRNWGYSSFPSGHSASAFALYSFLCFNVRRPKIAISILCFLLAAEVALSRMYLLYHFLRDVTAGAFLGLAVALIMYFLQWKVFPGKAWLNNGLRWRSTTDSPPPDRETTDSNS